MFWDRWNPLSELEALRREVDRAFEGYGSRGLGILKNAFLPGFASRAYPLINLWEDAENVYVQALAPGIDPERMSVTIEGRALTLTGEKRPLEGVKAEAYHRNERATGKFVRTVELGTEVDETKIKADYANGLLLVTMPKAAHAKPKQIRVSVK